MMVVSRPCKNGAVKHRHCFSPNAVAIKSDYLVETPLSHRDSYQDFGPRFSG